MKTDCPHCSQPIEIRDDAAGIDIQCPSCLQNFTIPTPPEIPGSSNTEKIGQAIKAITHDKNQQTLLELAKVQSRAYTLETLAKWLFIIGVIAILFGILAALGSDENTAVWIVAGSFWGSSLWIYLVAQVIHIRALLMRK